MKRIIAVALVAVCTVFFATAVAGLVEETASEAASAAANAYDYNAYPDADARTTARTTAYAAAYKAAHSAYLNTYLYFAYSPDYRTPAAYANPAAVQAKAYKDSQDAAYVAAYNAYAEAYVKVYAYVVDPGDIHRNLDWALDRALTRLVAEGGKLTSTLTRVRGFGFDRSGNLSPIYNLDYPYLYWKFEFDAETSYGSYDPAYGNVVHRITVHYNGEISHSYESYYSKSSIRPLPTNVVADFADWFTTVLTVFDTHLDGGDYCYMVGVGFRWEDDELCEATFSLYRHPGYVKIDVETGKVLVRSWE